MKALLAALMLAAAPAVQASGSPEAMRAVQATSSIAATAAMRPVAGAIELTASGENTVRFHIYSITGQQVKTIDVHQGTVRVDLPKGVYIVKCQEWSRQVVIKH